MKWKKQVKLSFQRWRSKYDIWRGFGSDGYLYDFVKKSYNYVEPKPKYVPPKPKIMPLHDKPVFYRFQRPRKYEYWRGFGSDGYLYDFVK